MKMTPRYLKRMILQEMEDCTDPKNVIYGMVKDMDPNAVAELFQAVFEQLPGVEMTRPEPEEGEPIPTTYQPGGEDGDRPVIGFREQLMELVRSAVREVKREVKRSAKGKAEYEAGRAAGKLGKDNDTKKSDDWQEGWASGHEVYETSHGAKDL